jgi:hypothetical protein
MKVAGCCNRGMNCPEVRVYRSRMDPWRRRVSDERRRRKAVKECVRTGGCPKCSDFAVVNFRRSERKEELFRNNESRRSVCYVVLVWTKGRKRGNVTVSKNVYVSANRRPLGK